MDYEYAHIPLFKIPHEIIEQYHLTSISHENHVMIEINKRMYGLPQADVLTNQQLVTRLKPYRYYETNIRSLFRHLIQYTSFTFVVNNFGSCTTSCTNLDHLHNALNSICTTNIDRTGALYLGISLKRDYEQRQVDVSMPA